MNAACWGSIPAYAGDPRRPAGERRVLGVYPRLRGGSVNADEPGELASGLSPPTRGILAYAELQGSLDRSIPAYAGDPFSLP